MTDTNDTGFTDPAHPTAGERLSASFVRVMDKVVAEARAELEARDERDMSEAAIMRRMRRSANHFLARPLDAGFDEKVDETKTLDDAAERINERRRDKAAE